MRERNIEKRCLRKTRSGARLTHRAGPNDACAPRLGGDGCRACRSILPSASLTSDHDASLCSHQASGATMQSSGQRHTPAATHSRSVSWPGAQPLLTSNHAIVCWTASAAVSIISESMPLFERVMMVGILRSSAGARVRSEIREELSADRACAYEVNRSSDKKVRHTACSMPGLPVLDLLGSSRCAPSAPACGDGADRKPAVVFARAATRDGCWLQRRWRSRRAVAARVEDSGSRDTLCHRCVMPALQRQKSPGQSMD
jgi:hypothetical protein